MNQIAFCSKGGFIDGTSSERAKRVLDGIRSSFDTLGFLTHVPWLMSVATAVARLPGPLRIVNDWSDEALTARKKALPTLII